MGVQVRAGMLADLPRRPIADLILLVHVLEHLPSPRGASMWERRWAGGRCYIEVPNAGAPYAAPSKMFHAGPVSRQLHP